MKKKPRKPCEICGIETKRSTTRFCSYTCCEAWRATQRENGIRFGGPKLRIVQKECPECHILFMPNNYKLKQKFCSYRCAGLSHADQARDLGISQKGKRKSAKAKENMSIAAALRPARTVYTKGIGGIRNDLGHYVRSRWEANVARMLQYENIPYTYEPEVLVLKDEKAIRYRPDFKTPDGYIEVKGWWNEKSLRIKQLILEQYPDIKIYYIDEPEYRKLEYKYSALIENWERRSHGCK